MGIFYEQKIVVNRAPVPLTVRFDGQETVIPVGESPLPVVSLIYAKNQNPIMGSADPTNPSLSGARYLIGVKGQDDCTPLTKDEWTAHCEAARVGALRLADAWIAESRCRPRSKSVTTSKP